MFPAPSNPAKRVKAALPQDNTQNALDNIMDML